MEVYVHFIPTSEIQVSKLCLTTTIRDLKILWEEKCGIPSDILDFVHNSVPLDDSVVLPDLGSSEFTSLDLLIRPAWEKMINSCMKGETGRAMARVRVKMNQLSVESRAFVAAFVAAHKGNSELLQALMESFKGELVHRTVCLSGRSLLHAAVLGGNISCVMTLVINGGWKMLNRADEQQEVPLQTARRMQNEDGLVKILQKYIEMYADGNRLDGSEVEQNRKETNDSGDQDGQLGRISMQGHGGDSPDAEQSWTVELKPSAGGSQEGPFPCAGTKLIRRNEASGSPPSLLAKHGESARISTQPKPNRGVAENCAVHLPLVRAEGNRSPLMSPKNTHRGRHNSLPRNVGKQARSPSPPPTLRVKLSTRRKRSGSLNEEQERLVRMQRNPARASSSAPNSPLLLRRRQTLPVSPLARGHEYPAPGHQPLLFPNRDKSHVVVFEKSRETLPWNVWKRTIRPWNTPADGGNTTIPRDANEEWAGPDGNRMCRHSKSFEAWLVEKKSEEVEKQSQQEAKAKQLAQHKLEEEMQKRTRSKTFDEWLREKESNMQPRAGHDVTEATKEARRAQAFSRYNEWLKRKDAEALEREEKIRAEEQRKYEELRKKREEEQRAKWTREKIGKANSVPI